MGVYFVKGVGFDHACDVDPSGWGGGCDGWGVSDTHHQ